ANSQRFGGATILSGSVARMEQIKIIYIGEDSQVEGGVYRSIETGYLLAPGIAVVPCLTTLFFLRVKPSAEEAGLYDDCGEFASFDVPAGCTENIESLPAEALAVAMWVAE